MLLAKYKVEIMIEYGKQSNDRVFKTTFLFRICLLTKMPHRLVGIKYSLLKKHRNIVTEIVAFDRNSYQVFFSPTMKKIALHFFSLVYHLSIYLNSYNNQIYSLLCEFQATIVIPQ